MSRDIAGILKKADLVRHEPVRLRSGKTSDFYVDIKKGFSDPGILIVIAKKMSSELDTKTTCIAATGHGGVPLAVAISLETGLPLVLIRDRVKGHGTGGMLDGCIPSSKDLVAVVDDVFTTGSSLRHTIKFLEETGAGISGCYVVVKRGEGELPVTLNYLVEAEELQG